MVVVDGMAHLETSELGREGVELGTKEYLVSLHSNNEGS